MALAAEAVAGALLSASLRKLFAKIDSQDVADFIHGKNMGGKKIQEGLWKLRILLSTANKVLNDAERRQTTDSFVRNWLEQLKVVIYDAEDLIYRIRTEALRCKVERGQSQSRKMLFEVRSFIPFRWKVRKVNKKIKKILKNLKFVLQQKDALGLIEGVETEPLRRMSKSKVREHEEKESDICGRGDDKEAIIKLLLLSDRQVDVIPIVGMGGLGKTTLAQLFYKGIDNEVMDKPFDVKAWVTVSDTFDVHTLQK